MATVEPKFSGVAPDQPQGAYFTVSIAQAGFSDAETTAGGRVSPCGASDFATKPTTLAQSLLVSRGQLRWKLMMNALAIRSNFRVVNIVTTYGSDAGDTAITTLAFGLVFENQDFIPTTGTSVDGSTTTTKAMYIADKIGEALNTAHTENCNVYDPTTSGGVTVRELSNTAVTVASVGANTGIIRDAITVTAVPGYAANTSGQLTADASLTYSAE
jgi:hypothetical protein